MAKEVIFHVINISEAGMQTCEVDSLSRGNTSAGVMVGYKLLAYLPFHFQRWKEARV